MKAPECSSGSVSRRTSMASAVSSAAYSAGTDRPEQNRSKRLSGARRAKYKRHSALCKGLENGGDWAGLSALRDAFLAAVRVFGITAHAAWKNRTVARPRPAAESSAAIV